MIVLTRWCFQLSISISIVLIFFCPDINSFDIFLSLVIFFLLQYNSEAFLSIVNNIKNKIDLCFAKMFVKMVAKLIFERAVM